MTDSVHRITEVVVRSNQMLGSKFEARNRTGSAYYISPEEIGKFGYTDINRMLKKTASDCARISVCAVRKPSEANVSH